MSATIAIYNADGTMLMQVPLTAQAEARERLMQEDCVKLSWNDTQGEVLSVGSYIQWQGQQYSLIEPYQPEQKSEASWLYEPEFQSAVMGWQKVPFFHYTETEGVDIVRNPDWSLAGAITLFGERIKKALQYETAQLWSVTYGDITAEYKTIAFQSADVFSALNEIASEFSTEWWADKAARRIHFGRIKQGDAVALTVGENIGVPTITQNKEGYYNRFYAFGSTRNIAQRALGSNTNYLLNYRLSLPPTECPNGYYDTEIGLIDRTAMSKVLIFDDIYPKSNLRIASCRGRLMYRLDEQGERKIVGYDSDNNPIYDIYTIWYFKAVDRTSGQPFAFNNETYDADHPNGMLLQGLNLSVHFESGALNGKEFELVYHDEEQIEKNIDGVDFLVEAGSYEIRFKEENNLIIPSSVELAPADGDNIVLFNIRMPEAYIASAQQELLSALQDEIAEKYAIDRNNYEVKSNAVAFIADDPNLQVGRNVTYRNGDYELSTRVIAIAKRLDQPSVQTITLGNSLIKGNRQTLQENIVAANKDINTLQALSTLTEKIIQSYLRSQEAMKEGFDRISRMWQFDPNDPTQQTIFSPYNVWVEGYLSAKGKGDEPTEVDIREMVEELITEYLRDNPQGGGGSDINYDDLEQWLAAKNLATKDDIPDTSGFLTEHQSIKKLKVNDGQEQEIKGSGTIEVNAVDEIKGGGHVTAGNLQADGSVQLGVEDGYGIPSTAKQQGWDAAKALLESMFEKVNLGTALAPKWSIKAKYGLWTEQFLSAKGAEGAGEDVGGSGSGGGVSPDIDKVLVIDRGKWVSGQEYFHYYEGKETDLSGRLEQSDVWHNGCKWRCLTDLTTMEPRWNSTDWAMIEGNPNFTVEIDVPEGFYDPDDFHAEFNASARLYNRDISLDCLPGTSTPAVSWEWRRRSYDYAGNERVASDAAWASAFASSPRGGKPHIEIDDADLSIDSLTGRPKKIVFIAIATLPDGSVQTQEIEIA